jgi:hypothetical protein
MSARPSTSNPVAERVVDELDRRGDEHPLSPLATHGASALPLALNAVSHAVGTEAQRIAVSGSGVEPMEAGSAEPRRSHSQYRLSPSVFRIYLAGSITHGAPPIAVVNIGMTTALTSPATTVCPESTC